MDTDGALRIVVYGTPVAKGRPRVTRLPSGRTHTFTPDRTAAWENSIRVQAMAQAGGQAPFDEPVWLEAAFFLPRPKSAPKRQQWPSRRPDLDNLLKSLVDAIQGIIIADDARIVAYAASKQYAHGEPPRVEVEVTPVERKESAS